MVARVAADRVVVGRDLEIGGEALPVAGLLESGNRAIDVAERDVEAAVLCQNSIMRLDRGTSVSTGDACASPKPIRELE